MEKPNILLIILDSVRAKNLGIYGHRNENTPFLSSFCKQATVYTQARSPGIHSIASHISIFTGYEVEEHGLTEHNSKLDPSRTVWTTLSEDGYDTGLFTPNAVITRSSNLGDSFDTVEGPLRRDVPYPSALTLDDIEGSDKQIRNFVQKSLNHQETLRSLVNGVSLKFGQNVSHAPDQEAAPIYTDAFLQWVNEKVGPWAACLNLMDAHYPYTPKEEFDLWGDEQLEQIHDDFPDGPGVAAFLNGNRPWWEVSALEARYDGCIRQLDAAIEQLITKLDKINELNDTYIIISSDHGECFGESMDVCPNTRTIGHRYGVPEPLTHIPLITRRPDQTRGEKVTDTTSLKLLPSAINQIRKNKNSGPLFLSDEPTLVSTYRLRKEGALTSYLERPEPYLGPWRAVYEDGECHVTKYIERGTDQATIGIPDAQSSYIASTDCGGNVTEIFNGLQRVDIGKTGSSPLEENIESHLEDLGYIQ